MSLCKFKSARTFRARFAWVIMACFVLLLPFSCKNNPDEEVPEVKQWNQLTSLPGAEREEAISFSLGDTLYVATGFNPYGYRADVWSYDTKAGQWTQKADFAGGPRMGMVTFSIQGKNYAGLGHYFEDGDHYDYNDFYVYQVETDTWDRIADFPGRDGAQHGAFAINGKAYVLDDYSWDYFRTWEYDPVTNEWTQKADCPSYGVVRMVTFVIDGKGYACSGWNGANCSKELWEYDPVADQWTQKADFPGIARADAIGFAISGTGYVGCGTSYEGDYYFDSFYDFYAYSPDDDAWTKIEDFPGMYPAAMFCSVINGTTYAGTGFSNGTGYSTDFWSFSPAVP